MKNIFSYQIKQAQVREMIWQGDFPEDIKPVIDTKMQGGKYRGKTYKYIICNDPRYIMKLSYCQIPSQVKDFDLEHIKFRITYYMPLKGDINNLITKYMNRSLTASYEYGDNYSKHEMM